MWIHVDVGRVVLFHRILEVMVALRKSKQINSHFKPILVCCYKIWLCLCFCVILSLSTKEIFVEGLKKERKKEFPLTFCTVVKYGGKAFVSH